MEKLRFDDFDNNFTALLNTSVNASDLTIYLSTVPIKATEGFLVLDADDITKYEVIYFNGKGANYVSCPSTGGRGQAGTTARSHDANCPVKMYFLSEHLKPLRDAIFTGWFQLNHVAAYASAATITIPTNLTAIFTAGRKLKLTFATSGAKYFKIVSSSYSAPNTIIVLSLETVLNEVINSIEMDVSPQAFSDDTLSGGWNSLGVCTYEGADAPTYTISFASDMTGILWPGMKFKCTDSTVKCFFIQAVGTFSGGKTIITVYGGTDYALSGGAITLPYYSTQKAPLGFPLNPTKWTIEVSDTTDRSQPTPGQNAWYNLGGVTISIPIGVWDVDYKVRTYVGGAAGVYPDIYTTLSTANNSESDNGFTFGISGGVANISVEGINSRRKMLVLASKTSYYLNTITQQAGAGTIYNFNARTGGKLIIRAICAYL